jgi:outer membrane receptor protein involved in Fe transport
MNPRLLPKTGLLPRFVAAGSAAFFALTSAVSAQVAPAASTATAPTETKPVPVTTAPGENPGDEVIQLSPFEVTSTADRGYQAISTMSGTRLNSKLEDVAASLSVITKQQLQDTASVDINDVFRYELNTEGTYQWTSFSVDRGNVTDDVQTNPAGATRVRGLTSANNAADGFTTSLPFDTYDVDAVEISRGPNSTVFGLGSTGGGVNVVKSKANLTKEFTSFTTRGDSYGGYRGNFDLNRVIVPRTLAVRILGVYEDKGFEREPSEDITRRLKLSATLRPFQNTRIYASFESYRNSNSRPNALTPRDTISDWVASGKPTWDPITQTVHFGDGRAAIANVTTSTESTLLPYGLATSDSGFQQPASAYIESNGTLGLFMISRMPNSTSVGPNNIGGTTRLLQNGSYYVRNSSAFPLFNPPQITDQSVYDWTSINLAAPNFSKLRGETTSVQIEQSILHSPRQSLDIQAAWLYERLGNYDRRFLGSGGAALQPFIDINEKLLDGTVNPYFLRTYVGGSAPSFRKGWNNNENYRATIAYSIDATHEENFLKWLGRHRFTAFGEYRSVKAANLGYQDTASSTNSWMTGLTSRNSNVYRTYPRYYVGDANGQNVDYAPARTPSPPYTYTLRYYNGVTQKWLTEDVTFDDYYDANRPNKRILSTHGVNWQGFLWNDRIVPLAGIRKDWNRSRDANSAINPTAATNGYYDTTPIYTFGTNDWVQNRGKTTTEGVVVKALSWLHLSYSQSNSFNPGSAVYDVWGMPLPDPRGKTKDYGFQLNLLDGRLVIVAKQYETIDIGRSTSDLNTIVQRAIRMDRRSSSGDPGLTDWYIAQLQTLHSDWDQATLVAEALKATGADYDYLRSHINKTHGDASNSLSRGKEIEIVFNPNRYWTTRATISQSNPINGRMSPAVQNYIDSRWETWNTIKDPVSGANWWTNRWSNNTIPRDFYINNVLANLKLAVALQGKRRTQTREYHAAVVTNYNLAGFTENRWLKLLDVGGAVRWEDKASIGFLGAAPDSDGIVREFDPTKPVWDKARYYVDLNAGYRLRFYHDKVQCRLQLNINNVLEDGRLQPVSVNPDGKAWAYRIVDPRQFILSATFSL